MSRLKYKRINPEPMDDMLDFALADHVYIRENIYKILAMIKHTTVEDIVTRVNKLAAARKMNVSYLVDSLCQHPEVIQAAKTWKGD